MGAFKVQQGVPHAAGEGSGQAIFGVRELVLLLLECLLSPGVIGEKATTLLGEILVAPVEGEAGLRRDRGMLMVMSRALKK